MVRRPRPGAFGISAKAFLDELQVLGPVPELALRTNSPGGSSATDVEGVAIVRLAEVNAAELVWPDGITGPEQTTALGELAALDIIAR